MSEPPASPSAQRPPLVAVAAGILAAIGVGMLAGAVLDVADLVASFAGQRAVDGMTLLVNMIIAAFVLAIMAAVAALGALHLVVAWRAWRGLPWAWVEGVAVALVGAGLHALSFASTPVPGPRAFLETPLAAAGIVLAAAAIVALVVERESFGPWRWPRTPAEAPFWLRPTWDRFGHLGLPLRNGADPSHDEDRAGWRR